MIKENNHMNIRKNNSVITMLLFELFRYLFMHPFKLNFLTLNTEFLYNYYNPVVLQYLAFLCNITLYNTVLSLS